MQVLDVAGPLLLELGHTDRATEISFHFVGLDFCAWIPVVCSLVHFI